jgi:hypothetical protein
MSMSGNIKGDSTIAKVLDVMVDVRGTKHVKVQYLDSIVRPDLYGRVSPWIDCTTDAWIDDLVRIEFAYEGDRRFGGFFRPYVGRRHSCDEELGIMPRKPVQAALPDKPQTHHNED